MGLIRIIVELLAGGEREVSCVYDGRWVVGRWV